MTQLHIGKSLCLVLMGVIADTPVFAGKILDEILAKKTIVVGYRETAIPYSFLDNKGESIGYSLDVCRKIIEKINKEKKVELTVQYQPVVPQNWIPMIQNGTLHMVCAGATITPERSEKARFAVINADVMAPAVLATNASITKKEDLKGKKIIVAAGSAGENLIHKLNRSEYYNMTIIPAKDYPEALRLLEKGEGDAVITDKILLAHEDAKGPKEKKFKLLNIPLSPFELIGIMFTKEDSDLERIIHTQVTAMKQDESLFKLYNQWFNQPIGPEDINLKVALTPELKKIITDAK